MQEASKAASDKDRDTAAKFSIRGKTAKIELLTSQSDQSGTFCIWEEDHTLGNVLRQFIMRKYFSRQNRSFLTEC